MAQPKTSAVWWVLAAVLLALGWIVAPGLGWLLIRALPNPSMFGGEYGPIYLLAVAVVVVWLAAFIAVAFRLPKPARWVFLALPIVFIAVHELSPSESDSSEDVEVELIGPIAPQG